MNSRHAQLRALLCIHNRRNGDAKVGGGSPEICQAIELVNVCKWIAGPFQKIQARAKARAEAIDCSEKHDNTN